MTKAEQLTPVVTYHGEGPVWDSSIGQLHFVDMLAGDLLTLDGGDVTRKHVGDVCAVWRPRTGGGGIVGVERGFALLDPDGTQRTLPEVFGDSAHRMNEGGCDPQGRFYCGTMAYAETPGAGTLYRLDPDGSIATVLTGVTISNGIVWSLDGGTVYYVDSPTHQIAAFDFDAASGTLHNRRTVVTVTPEAAVGDGLTIDAEGLLWVALWGGSAVHRYSPEGELAEVIELPATQVTCCAFGGPDLDTLYITSSRKGLADGEQPAAGALFAAVPGVQGAPVRPYAG